MGPAHPLLPRQILAAHRTSELGPLPSDVAAAFYDAAAALAELACCLVRRTQPGGMFDGDPDLDWFTLATAEHVSALGRPWVRKHMDGMHPPTQAFVADGLALGIDDYIATRRRRLRHARVLDELLGADTVLLSPTVAVASILADGRLSGTVTWPRWPRRSTSLRCRTSPATPL